MKRLSLLLLVAALFAPELRAQDSRFQPFPLPSAGPTNPATPVSATSAPVTPAAAIEAAPRTNAPVTVGGVTLDNRHRLAPGDRVSFQVLEDRDEAKPLVVTDSGELDVPYVGRVRVAGRTCHEVAAELKELLEKDFYYRATVVLGLDQINRVAGRVYVWGEVRQQGAIEIPANENFTAGKAILRAGGFSDWARRNRVRVVRAPKFEGGPKEELTVDMDAILKDGKTELDVTLQPDDLIIVPRRAINF
ncbi:MAG: polysaccharide biosynthesis/export family protein [Limisphaerales bacterium]